MLVDTITFMNCKGTHGSGSCEAELQLFIAIFSTDAYFDGSQYFVEVPGFMITIIILQT